MVDVLDGALRVFPWPAELEGPGTWPIEGIIGGGVRLAGGNTTQVSIDAITAQYCGHGLHVVSLYGCNAASLIAEVAGSALTLAARSSALRGFTLRGLHGELTLADVVAGGLSIQRAVILGGAEAVTPGRSGYQVVPRLKTGAPTPWTWPVTQIPGEAVVA